MQPEENKALIRRFVEEVLNQKNLDAVDELLTPDHLDHSVPPGLPPGREGIRQGMAMYLAAFPDLQVTIDDQIAEGDKVTNRYTSRATHRGELFGLPPTGNRVTYTTTDVIRVAGGKLAKRWAVDDRLGMMQQLGVVPSVEQAEGQPA